MAPSTEVLTVTSLVFTIVVLGYASLLDWRTRRVRNPVWIALSAAGLVFLAVRVFIEKQPIEYLLISLPILAILADVYLDPDSGGPVARAHPALKYGAAIAMTVAMALVWHDSQYFLHLLAIPVFMILVVLMYALDVIRGGADAKALLSLAIMFPFLPEVGGLPILIPEYWFTGVMFPFTLVVLIDAAILVAVLPIAFLVRNILSRELLFPQSFLGYKKDIDDTRDSYVWLMERIENGGRVVYSKPRRNEDLGAELDRFAEIGVDRVWVTPKIPFIVPIFFSVILTTVIGNLLLLIMGT